MNKVKELTNN